MRLGYTVEKDDLARALEYGRLQMTPKKRPDAAGVRGFGLVIFAINFWGDLKIFLAGGGAGQGLIIAAVLLAALMVLASRVARLFLRLDVALAVKHNLAAPEYAALELRPDGFIETIDGQALEMKWTRLKNLAVDNDGRILLLTHGLEFFVIPPSAFRCPEELDWCLQAISAASGRPVESWAPA